MLQLNDAVDIAMAMRGYNKKMLAAKISMSPSALTDFLNGKTSKLDVTKARDIARVLGCTLDYLVGADTLSINVGWALKAEREEHGDETFEVSSFTKIPEALILKYESEDEPVSNFLLGKLCEYYGFSVPAFLQKYELYDEYIPPQFNGDVDAYEAFKVAEIKDLAKQGATFPELKDIIEQGLYTVNGEPARRSFKHDLELAAKRIYMNPEGVWSPDFDSPEDIEAATAEYIEVTEKIGDDLLVEELQFVLKRAKTRDDKLDIAMTYYHKALAMSHR